LKGANVVKRRSVHAVAMLVVGAGEKLPSPIFMSRPLWCALFHSVSPIHTNYPCKRCTA